jgi:chymotrypsin
MIQGFQLKKSIVHCSVTAVVACCAMGASAIVIRDDVEDTKYRVSPTDFPALVDMPGEGHGVLITPHWVVTAAHAVTWQSQMRQVTISGVRRDVDRIVIHPGYKKPPQELLDQSLESWDWTLFRSFLSSSADIALVRLTHPATDVMPAALSDVADEYGKIVMILGKGATGHGVSGYQFSDPRRTELRRAYNRVSSVHEGWFCYTFDSPAGALPLEGGTGSGDSGGPILVQADGGWRLAGLTSWVDAQSTSRTPGRYGQVSCNVRLSHYKAWIESVMTTRP